MVLTVAVVLDLPGAELKTQGQEVVALDLICQRNLSFSDFVETTPFRRRCHRRRHHQTNDPL